MANVTEVVFVNVYDPEDAAIQIGGLKKLHGAQIKEGMFRFELYESNESFQLLNLIQTASNNADGTFVFENPYCATVGVFCFAVAEDASNPLEGVTYDTTVYGLKVTVTDNANGQLSASMVITELGNDNTTEILFENTYEPVDPPTDPTNPTEPGDDPTTGDQPGFGRYYLIAMGSMMLLGIAFKKRKRLEGN